MKGANLNQNSKHSYFPYIAVISCQIIQEQDYCIVVDIAHMISICSGIMDNDVYNAYTSVILKRTIY